MDLKEIEKAIIEWGFKNQSIVKEIYLIGSFGRNQKIKKSKKSDLDIMLFIDAHEIPDYLYNSLADLGIDIGLLIHPLFILEKDRQLKLNIKEYSDALNAGRKILPNIYMASACQGQNNPIDRKL